MYWRFILDPPHSFAVEQGCLKSKYEPDFRESPGCFVNTWRCPVTNLIMLEPSFRKRDFGSDFKNLANFTTTTTSGYWQTNSKTADGVSMFSNVRPAGGSASLIEILVTTAIVAIDASASFQDELKWALESNFTLNIDEGFAIHYQGLTDEMLRKNNLFYVQWDNIGIHISQQGRVRVYEYADRGDLATSPTLVHDFDIADPGDFLGKPGRFVFLPIAGRGLVMYHMEKTAKSSSYLSNTNTYSVRGAHLIPWTARFIGSHFRLFETSQVRLALNPHIKFLLGFQNITYPASGTFLEEVFDPEYRPSFAPDDVSASALEAFGMNFGTVGATLRNAGNTANWTAGTDRQGRILFNLATSDTRYTPFVYGWGVQWLPVFATRATTPITITTGFNDVFQRLEWTDDSEGKFEGVAHLKLKSAAAVAIAERGDATYQIEYSSNGTDWTVLNGGLCKFPKLGMQFSPGAGYWWEGDVALYGMEARFDEMHMALGTAFDGMSIGESLNLVLQTVGFSAIPEADMPARALDRRLPPVPEGEAQTQFRFVPRGGDKANKVIRDLLLMLAAQYREYKLKYDWSNSKWILHERTRDTSAGATWTIATTQAEEDHPNRVAYCDAITLEVEPPEHNAFCVIGMTSPDVKGKRIISDPIKNLSSITDPLSVDYAGRVKSVQFVVESLTTIEEVNMMALRIAPRVVMGRNLRPQISIPPGHFNLSLAPDLHVTTQKPGGSTLVNCFVKVRTVVVDKANHSPVAGRANESMMLFCDENWENEIMAEG
jgi:hypothetical protein